MKKNFIGFLFLVPLLITACTVPYDDLNTAPSSLTPGVVKTEIVTGETTQAEVLEVFGPPDLVTVDKGIELWGYDKISRETAYSSFGILAGGLAGPAVAGGVVRGGKTTQTTKTVFLLIYFKNDVVVDHKLSATKF